MLLVTLSAVVSFEADIDDIEVHSACAVSSAVPYGLQVLQYGCCGCMQTSVLTPFPSQNTLSYLTNLRSIKMLSGVGLCRPSE